MHMDNIIKYFETIETSFRKMKFITVASIASGIIVALGAVFIAGQQMLSGSDNIYVITTPRTSHCWSTP